MTGPARFPTTQWSVVVSAQGAATPDARQALERLFDTYWYPVYAFIRSRTRQHADAEDLTQGFFTSLLSPRSPGVGAARIRPFPRLPARLGETLPLSGTGPGANRKTRRRRTHTPSRLRFRRPALSPGSIRQRKSRSAVRTT